MRHRNGRVTSREVAATRSFSIRRSIRWFVRLRAYLVRVRMALHESGVFGVTDQWLPHESQRGDRDKEKPPKVCRLLGHAANLSRTTHLSSGKTLTEHDRLSPPSRQRLAPLNPRNSRPAPAWSSRWPTRAPPCRSQGSARLRTGCGEPCGSPSWA